MTTLPPVSVYACADGTPFPVAWDDPAHAALLFRWNQDHWPRPWSPLAVALEPLRAVGRARAHAEAGVPIPIWQTHVLPHGFHYNRTTPPAPDEVAANERGCDALVARCGGVDAVWADWSLPRVRAACAALVNRRGHGSRRPLPCRAASRSNPHG